MKKRQFSGCNWTEYYRMLIDFKNINKMSLFHSHFTFKGNTEKKNIWHNLFPAKASLLVNFFFNEICDPL